MLTLIVYLFLDFIYIQYKKTKQKYIVIFIMFWCADIKNNFFKNLNFFCLKLIFLICFSYFDALMFIICFSKKNYFNLFSSKNIF
jgi:hypothetical protein